MSLNYRFNDRKLSLVDTQEAFNQLTASFFTTKHGWRTKISKAPRFFLTVKNEWRMHGLDEEFNKLSITTGTVKNCYASTPPRKELQLQRILFLVALCVTATTELGFCDSLTNQTKVVLLLSTRSSFGRTRKSHKFPIWSYSYYPHDHDRFRCLCYTLWVQ